MYRGLYAAIVNCTFVSQSRWFSSNVFHSIEFRVLWHGLVLISSIPIHIHISRKRSQLNSGPWSRSSLYGIPMWLNSCSTRNLSYRRCFMIPQRVRIRSLSERPMTVSMYSFPISNLGCVPVITIAERPTALQWHWSEPCLPWWCTCEKLGAWIAMSHSPLHLGLPVQPV